MTRKTKIAYLTGEFPRPTDTWIRREIEGLRDNGADVTTFSIRRPHVDQIVSHEQAASMEETSYVLEEAKSVALVTSHLKLFIRSPRRYAKALKVAHITKRRGLKGNAMQGMYLLEAGVLAAKLKKQKITHLHNHFGDSSCTVAMLASILSGIPFSFSLHGPAIFYDANLWRLDKKIEHAKFVSCISFFCRSQAAVFADHSHIDKLKIIHCGVQPQNLTQVTHTDEGRNLLFVARLEELKGVPDLLKAVAKVAETIDDVYLTIIGDGPGRERFEKLAQKLGIEKSVTFTGYLSQDDVAKRLAATDCFVLPSYAEGVPVTFMEALGSGVPVVATQVGGVSELVEDGVNGFIVRPGDVEQLSEAITKLLMDNKLRQQFGQAGRQKVLREFNSAEEAKKLQVFFES